MPGLNAAHRKVPATPKRAGNSRGKVATAAAPKDIAPADSAIAPLRNAAAGLDVATLATQLAEVTAELAGLRRRLAVIEQVERYRDIVLNRHATQPWTPPSSFRIDARDFHSAAEGVYSLEYDNTGTAYRWTGPDHFTRFRFNVDRAVPLSVRFVLWWVGKNIDGTPLTVDVEGATYPLRPADDPHAYIAGPVPPRDGSEPTDVFLHVPVLHMPQDDGSSDNRRLGVAVTSISLEPFA